MCGVQDLREVLEGRVHLDGDLVGANRVTGGYGEGRAGAGTELYVLGPERSRWHDLSGHRLRDVPETCGIYLEVDRDATAVSVVGVGDSADLANHDATKLDRSTLGKCETCATGFNCERNGGAKDSFVHGACARDQE